MMSLFCHTIKGKNKAVRVRMRMIKNYHSNKEQLYIFQITIYHFEEEADDRINLQINDYISDDKTMIMNMMQFLLENIEKSKVMKKLNNLLVQT